MHLVDDVVGAGVANPCVPRSNNSIRDCPETRISSRAIELSATERHAALNRIRGRK